MPQSEDNARDQCLEAAEVGPLLDGISDPSLDVRVAVLEAVTRLPLGPDDWMKVAALAARALDSTDSMRARGMLLEAARWIPVRSFHQRVVMSLLGELDDPSASRRNEVARQLAMMDVSKTLDPLRQWCHTVPPTDEVRFWLAVAMARAGEDDELKAFFIDAHPYLHDVLARSALPKATTAWLYEVVMPASTGSASDHAEIAYRFLGGWERERDEGSPLHPAWAFGRPPGFTSYTESERAEATAAVEALDLIEGQWGGLSAEGMRVIVERDLAPAAVTVLYEQARRRLGAWWQLGNEIVGWLEGVQGRFRPDLEGLFEVYRQQAEELFASYGLGSCGGPSGFVGVDDDGGPRSFCYQIGWTVSRGGLRGLVPGLAAHLAAEDSAERIAAAYQIADAADYVTQRSAEKFGGGFAPGRSGVRAIVVEDLEEPEPRRQALYALLECEPEVTAQHEFELRVGLSDQPQPQVISEPMHPPPTVSDDYVVVAHVVADGFSVRASEGWIHELAIRRDEPLPAVTLHLTPQAQDQDVARAIKVTYAVGGQSIGFAVRTVLVRGHERVIGMVAPTPEEGVALALPTSAVPADLTVTIMFGKAEHQGRLVWTFDTPHQGVTLPCEELATDVGENPAAFARQLVGAMKQHEKKADLLNHLKGVGRSIADHMPLEFWDVLAQVSARTKGRAPTVLLLSEEPYVPWELAKLPHRLDKSRLPFLAAQVDVGRWILARKPPPTPPSAHEVEALAVISGRYRLGTWQRLLEAEGEADDLKERYRAIGVNADLKTVIACLEGTPKAELLHFALHGTYDPDADQDGLVLVDRELLAPTSVKGTDLPAAPFVFLNACQVGSGAKVLGDYAGLAESFLYAGASAVVAPLWSVDDALSRQLALRFYARVFAGDSPARALREERASLGEPPSATALAYVYFGHPKMRLTMAADHEEEHAVLR